MGKPKVKKTKKSTKKTTYQCEICQGTEPDKPVVACDKCDKWYHFSCVGIKSIGRKDNWSCATCKTQEIPETSSSEQSIPTVVGQVNPTFPSTSQNAATLSSRNQEKIVNEKSGVSTHVHEFTQQREHRSSDDQRSQITVSHSSRASRASNKASSRQRIQLELIEEDRRLQEQRDQRYLERKFRILMGHQDAKKHTESSLYSRTTYVRTWAESQQASRKRIDPDNDVRVTTPAEERFNNRIEEMNFDMSVKSKRLDPSIQSNKSKTTMKPCEVSKTKIDLFKCDICRMVGEEKSFVKCCLCFRKAHHVCMDTMYIDKELNWICYKCKDPEFKSNVRNEDTHQLISAPVDKPSGTSMKSKPFTSNVCQQFDENATVCKKCNTSDEKQPFVMCYRCGEIYHALCISMTKVNNQTLWACTKCKEAEFTSTIHPQSARNFHQPPSFVELDHESNMTKNILPTTNTFQQQLPMEQVIQSTPPMENVIPSTHSVTNTLTSAQIAARHVVTKDLPIFVGRPDQWPMFISRFNNSTELCGFSNSENLDRLQKCLKGNAYDAVRSRLLTAEAVPGIIATLKMLYGRPELIINALMKKIRSESPPQADKLNTIVDYALAVKNVCATLEMAKMSSHLSNRELVKELTDKLPANIKIEWAKHKATIENVTLSTLGDFLYNLAEVISTVTDPTPPKETKFEKQNWKKEPERSNKNQDWGDMKSYNWRKDSVNLNVHRGSQFHKGDKNKNNLTRPDVHKKESADGLDTESVSNQTGRSVVNDGSVLEQRTEPVSTDEHVKSTSVKDEEFTNGDSESE